LADTPAQRIRIGRVAADPAAVATVVYRLGALCPGVVEAHVGDVKVLR
jgi:hypothetical protein